MIDYIKVSEMHCSQCFLFFGDRIINCVCALKTEQFIWINLTN